MNLGKGFYTVKEVAEFCKTSYSSIRRKVKSGELKVIKQGKKQLIKTQDVENFLKDKEKNELYTFNVQVDVSIKKQNMDYEKVCFKTIKTIKQELKQNIGNDYAVEGIRTNYAKTTIY